jgi:lysozyme family protein
MTAANYPNCLKLTLAYEGGYSNHPADPGGVTLEGIIQRVYDEYRRQQGKPQKKLTPDMRGTTEWINERNDIYRQNYWAKVVGDQWPAGADLVVWDTAVNSGPARAKKLAEAVLGPSTIFGALAASVRASGDSVPFIKKFCARRQSFYEQIKFKASFIKGWTKRNAAMEANGVRMALAAQGAAPADQKKQLENEGVAADKKAKTNGKSAAGTGTAGAGTGTAATQGDWSNAEIALAVAGVLALAALTWFLIQKWRVHRARATAYAEVASTTGV